MTRRGCYEPGQLSLVLEDRLGPEGEAALGRHLETCEACQTTLEGLAADAAEWAAMREFLLPKGRDDGDFDLDDLRPASTGSGSDAAAEAFLTAGFLAPSDDPAYLGRIGPYEVTGVIGRGGMSVVLKAFDRPLGRNVAVKVLAPQLAASAAARRRFAREARAAAAVVHEHVIPIYAVAEHGGLPYLVMPYYPARSLQKRIDEAGPLGIPEVLRIARQVASGLAAAHAQGLVHRDVKPANILLENGVERAVVSDFGLARAIDDASVTCSGTIAGTPQYMAPEQARGEAVDHRADLFSLGSVVYAMCTGHPPFRAETTLGVLRRVCEEDPRPLREVNPDVPEWLADAVAVLHEKDPAERFGRAREAEEYFEQALAFVQNPTGMPRPPSPRPARRRIATPEGVLRTRRVRLPALAVALLVTATGLTWFGGSALRGLAPGPDARTNHSAETSSTDERRSAEAASSSGFVDSADVDLDAVYAGARSVERAWSAADPGGDPWAGEISRLRHRAAQLSDLGPAAF